MNSTTDSQACGPVLSYAVLLCPLTRKVEEAGAVDTLHEALEVVPRELERGRVLPHQLTKRNQPYVIILSRHPTYMHMTGARTDREGQSVEEKRKGGGGERESEGGREEWEGGGSVWWGERDRGGRGQRLETSTVYRYADLQYGAYGTDLLGCECSFFGGGGVQTEAKKQNTERPQL